MKEPLPLPSEACYLYITDGDGQTFSETENIVANTDQVILSLFGLTAGEMVSEQPVGSIDSIIVHFSQPILRGVFEEEKPELWEELESPVTQYVVQSAADELNQYSPIPRQKILISTIWIFVLINMIYAEIVGMLRPGYIELLERMSNELTRGTVLTFSILLEVPIIMILLSRVLNRKSIHLPLRMLETKLLS
jgi:hypothetical protein